MKDMVLSRRAGPRRSRGVSLIFALIGLVVLTLAAVALVRSVDTGTLVLGNLGFKQDATKSGDQGVEQAATWIIGTRTAGGEAALYADGATGTGYWATSHDTVDPTGNNHANTARAVVDWEGNNCSSYPSGSFGGGCLTPHIGTDVSGNKIKYAVFRMCSSAGAPGAANDCATVEATPTNPQSIQRNSLDDRKYERLLPDGAGSADRVYFRIIVRTLGGKNSVSFTEAMVY